MDLFFPLEYVQFLIAIQLLQLVITAKSIYNALQREVRISDDLKTLLFGYKNMYNVIRFTRSPDPNFLDECHAHQKQNGLYVVCLSDEFFRVMTMLPEDQMRYRDLGWPDHFEVTGAKWISRPFGPSFATQEEADSFEKYVAKSLKLEDQDDNLVVIENTLYKGEDRTLYSKWKKMQWDGRVLRSVEAKIINN